MPLRILGSEERLAFAREFKAARAVAVRDAEGFDELLFVLERFGCHLTRSQGNLGQYKEALRDIAGESALSHTIPLHCPVLHVNFDSLYESVRIGRNDALHQGTGARHLARNAPEIALIMEAALMNGA